MVLAQNYYTPVSYWLGIELRELQQWIQANNELVGEKNAEMEKIRRQRQRKR